ncbi:hypothetical protein VaNZ11_001897 [Volvox africanus]|uniref:Kinesin motor domain-containing protein n=1 Tax=Volvox africanus TaxID=51714 RepID=A0ABQ5RR47_9CHLO|nr:hypothetical protein VaNZ11_001897 [Volvox africanus]
MALPAPLHLALQTEGLDGEEPGSPSGSDGSEMLPRRLRYSEAIIPLHYCGGIENSASSAANSVAAQPQPDSRPLRVYARIKPAELTSAGFCRSNTSAAAAGGGDGGAAAASCNSSWLQTSSTDVVLRMRDGAAAAFSFDGVFAGSEQQAFFNTTVEPLVVDLVSMRIASSVYMAYGASGTGKSYTMQGTAEQPGVIPRTLQRLFQMLTERSLEHQVQLSYYEVYGNKVTDLLRPLNMEKVGGNTRGAAHPPGAKPGGAQHRERPTLPIVRMGAGFCLPGLLLCHSSSVEEGLGLFRAAVRHRKKDGTKVNSESSRSHAVFTIQLLEVAGGLVQGRSATLSLVDLAGTERATQTQHVGRKLRESAGINSSLSVLRRCLEALRHNQALAQRAAAAGAAAQICGARMRAPVRESGLTTLFSSVLSGQGNLALSVHLSPHLEDYALTLESLKLGALASQVTMSAAAPEAAVMPPPLAAPHRSRVGSGGICGSSAPEAAAVPGGTWPLPRIASEVAAPIPEEEDEGEEDAVDEGEGGEGGGARGTQKGTMQQQHEQAVDAEEKQQGQGSAKDMGVGGNRSELNDHHRRDQPMAAIPEEEVEEEDAATGMGATVAGAAMEKARLAASAVTINAAAVAVVIGPGVAGAASPQQSTAAVAGHRYDIVKAGELSSGVRPGLQGKMAAAGDQCGEVSGLLQQLQEQLGGVVPHNTAIRGTQAAFAAVDKWAGVICKIYDSMGTAIRLAISLERRLAASQREVQTERASKQALEQQLRTALSSLQDHQTQMKHVQTDGQMQGHVHIGLHQKHHNQPPAQRDTSTAEEAAMARADSELDGAKPRNVVASAIDPGALWRPSNAVKSPHAGGSSYPRTERAAVAVTTAPATEEPPPLVELQRQQRREVIQDEEDEEQVEEATGRERSAEVILVGKQCASRKLRKRRHEGDGGDGGASEGDGAWSSRGQGGDVQSHLAAAVNIVAAAVASGVEAKRRRGEKGRPGKRPRGADRNGAPDGGGDVRLDPSMCGPGRAAEAPAATADGGDTRDSKGGKLYSGTITRILTPVAGRTRRAKQHAAVP